MSTKESRKKEAMKHPDKLGAAYTALLPIMVKAIQELNQQVKDLKKMMENK